MNLITKPKKSKFETLSAAKTVRVMNQLGRSNEKWDKPRKALPPGKRISKTGKVYWETRKNRSDRPGQKV